MISWSVSSWCSCSARLTGTVSCALAPPQSSAPTAPPVSCSAVTQPRTASSRPLRIRAPAAPSCSCSSCSVRLPRMSCAVSGSASRITRIPAVAHSSTLELARAAAGILATDSSTHASFATNSAASAGFFAKEEIPMSPTSHE